MYRVTFNYPRWSGDYVFSSEAEAKQFAKFWGGNVVPNTVNQAA